VLVLRALGLGDFLTAVPALRALREHFHDRLLLLAAPASLAPLARLSGAADAVVPVGPLEPLPEACHQADVAVNLHGRGPQSHRILLDTAPRRLIAFEHPAIGPSRGQPVWRARERELERWCRLLLESGIATDAARLDLPAPPILPPADVHGATIIHPGAADLERRWPSERWAAVAHAEVAAGRRVLVTGSAAETELAEKVAAGAELPPGCNLAGRTGLGELAAAVAAAGRVAASDTGVAHLATALGTPSVVLFGPSSPTEWGPPPDRPQHRVIRARSAGPWAPARVEDIEVSDVVAALDAADHWCSAAINVSPPSMTYDAPVT
jgi:hypothetical protein